MSTTTRDGEARRERNRRTLDEFMDAVGEADFERLAEICTADFVAEFPYDDPPRRIEGFDAYLDAVRPALEIFRFRLVPGDLYPAQDPDLLIAEYTSDGVAVPTGKPYRNVYVGMFRFRDGRLAGIREYWNPAISAAALAQD